MRIVIFGGSGFIGRHLAATLATEGGHQLVLPVRNRERVKDDLILLPDTDVLSYDSKSSAAIHKTLSGADVVVNLVGVLNETERHLFDRVHGEFVRVLLNCCSANKVPHIVHVSALGAASGASSAYLRSKAKAEQIIHAEGAVRHTIVRPSVVFGEGAGFIKMFTGLLRYFPIIPLPGAAAQIQPLAVADLTAILARVLREDVSDNRILHVAGPQVLTLRQMVEGMAAAMGLRRRIIPLGYGLSYAMAAVTEIVPFVNLLTRDNIMSLRTPSVCVKNGNDAQQLLEALTEWEAWLRSRISAAPHRDSLRLSAGR